MKDEEEGEDEREREERSMHKLSQDSQLKLLMNIVEDLHLKRGQLAGNQERIRQESPLSP